MKYCSNCGKEVMDEAVICINCGCSIGNTNPNQSPYQNQFSYKNPPEDIPSTGLNVLAFFLPVVGLILYLVNKDQTPFKASEIGKCALCGFITGIILSVLLTIFYSLFFVALI